MPLVPYSAEMARMACSGRRRPRRGRLQSQVAVLAYVQPGEPQVNALPSFSAWQQRLLPSCSLEERVKHLNCSALSLFFYKKNAR